MKKKCNMLALWLFCLAVATFMISFFLYHFTLPGGAITLVWQANPGKPFVTELVANLGVLFLFGGIVSLLVGKIFFPKE